MTAPTPTPLERALKELPEWTIEASAPFNDLLAQLGAALLRQDARLAEVERERDDAMRDYKALEADSVNLAAYDAQATALAASQAREAKLRAALERCALWAHAATGFDPHAITADPIRPRDPHATNCPGCEAERLLA